jgi:hypothetical protein
MAARHGRWRPTASTAPSGCERCFEEAFPLDLMSDDVAQVTAFFTAEPGTRIAAAEVAGRRAFLDPGLEELANDAFREAITRRTRASTF